MMVMEIAAVRGRPQACKLRSGERVTALYKTPKSINLPLKTQTSNLTDSADLAPKA